MSSVLVYVETRDGRVPSQSCELIAMAHSIAQSAGVDLEALVIGPLLSDQVGELRPAKRAIFASDAQLADYIPQAFGLIAAHAVSERAPIAAIFPYTTVGMDLAPFVAEKTGRPLVSFCSTVVPSGEDFEATSLLHDGKVSATVATKRGSIFAMATAATRPVDSEAHPMPEIVDLDCASLAASDSTRFLAKHVPDRDALDLAAVERIVCVGRGIGSVENIQSAADFAKLIGAELAGSRPIIDSGWLPKPRQVGKSGSRVSPKLYIAFGISGAPEHLEGMLQSERIIAINTDPTATIFSVAHYGAVVDAVELLDELGRLLGREVA